MFCENSVSRRKAATPRSRECRIERPKSSCRHGDRSAALLLRTAPSTALQSKFVLQISNACLYGTIIEHVLLNFTLMAEPIQAITLPPPENAQQEGEWLRASLLHWLNEEFIPEAVNQEIAARASQIYVRHRMEGENDLGSLVIALVTEMQAFDFSKSFFGEFAVANAVSDLLLKSLGIDNRCCGQSAEKTGDEA